MGVALSCTPSPNPTHQWRGVPIRGALPLPLDGDGQVGWPADVGWGCVPSFRLGTCPSHSLRTCAALATTIEAEAGRPQPPLVIARNEVTKRSPPLDAEVAFVVPLVQNPTRGCGVGIASPLRGSR